jgi:fructose-bisphosphate aldolase class 1
MLNETREIRKTLLAKLMDENEAESWCISKHLLAASMRIMEVGTKYQKDGKKEEAEKMFKQAFHVYGMFWALRLKIVDLGGVKKVADGQLNVHDNNPSDPNKPWSVEDIVNKLVNCCNE